MAKSQRLKIDLDRPENGWLQVELSYGDQAYSFYPSYTPYDSVSELVNALLKIFDGYDKAIVHWNDEPVEHEFVFEPASDQIDFRVYLINEAVINRNRESLFAFDPPVVIERNREQVFAFKSSFYDVVWPFWKALRDMQSRQSLEEYEAQWRRPFPEREMTELTSRIEELKRRAAKG